MAYITLDNVSYEYPGGFLAVEDVALGIQKGENVAIVGQNGAGKTTLVRMLNRLLVPTKGDVLVGGMNSKDHTTAQMSRVVGYVFQNPDDQIFHSTIEKEVEFGPKMMKLDDAEIKRRMDDALTLTGLAAQREENPYNLPLSVRKFVTIASIIAMDTDVMVLDEPTAGQDLAGNRRLETILKTMLGRGKTLVTISHDMEFVANNFARVIVMANRRVLCDDAPQNVFWNFEALKEAKLAQPHAARVCRALGIGGVIRTQDAVDAIAAAAGLGGGQ